ncbi:hypothetical protein ACU686_23280 [Yinghuangia aomiensis]
MLLVEGNADIAAAFTASLMRRGMDVAHVTSEREAVSKASSVEPNLVVLDLMLVGGAAASASSTGCATTSACTPRRSSSTRRST